MCGGHHDWEGASHCCCRGGGHPQHGCGCGGHRHHGWGGASHCCCGGGHPQHGCGCGGPFGFQRRFSTREEDAAGLEQYLKELEAEATGVRERLTALKES